MKESITYKSSGVDIDQANTFVKGIRSIVKATQGPQVLTDQGGFGSLFALSGMKVREPVLVSSTDGVGTKLLIAQQEGIHHTVGIDLVAMNVNDILCVGARPLFFLDYIACGRLKPSILKSVVSGVAKGCRQAECSLIGGETAEMPGLYKRDEYDLAGFAVGVVERKKLIDGSRIRKGDIVIGLASSGIHSNGYSLVRKVFSFRQQKELRSQLLRPTRIYVRPVLDLTAKFDIRGIAHITGGAFYDKLTKVLPKGKGFVIRKKSWRIPKIFRMIQQQGCVPQEEMYRTFNMGIGMVLVAPQRQERAILRYCERQSIRAAVIGEVQDRCKEKFVLV